MLRRYIKGVKIWLGERQRKAAREQAARTVIAGSKLFDPSWYSTYYPDVAAAGLDPLDHFVRHGAAEGRNPSERFDSRWYLRRNPDVADTGINPLLHYLQYGRDEGRSIRAVGKASDAGDFAPEANAGKKRTKTSEPAVFPYPSDFTPVRKARTVDWRALSPQLRPTEARNRAVHDSHAVQWISDLLSAPTNQSASQARLRLFQTMRRDPRPAVRATPALVPDDETPEAHRLLSTHGLGFDAIADGWFAGQGRLMIRVRSMDTRATRLRAFQYRASGAIMCCADVGLGNGSTQLISLSLDQELCPVLLAWQASDDGLSDSALIPFPTLFRGGLHHAELAAGELLTGHRGTVGRLMSSLALQTYCWPDPQDGFAIGRLAVDLQGANGAEPLFRPGVATALAAQFGLELTPQPPSDHHGLLKLSQRLANELEGNRAHARAESGLTLILPADGFPSLASIAARSLEAGLGVGSFCIVDAGTGQPEALVCLPALANGLDDLRHPALPLPAPRIAEASPSLTAAARQSGSPVMIRFFDPKMWQVDALMPLSPDLSMSIPTTPAFAEALDGRVTVIIGPSDNDASLKLCLASLARQTIAERIHILHIGGNDDSLAPSGASLAERLNLAASGSTSDYLLFLDPVVCLPDPATIALLLIMVAGPTIASASCALIVEDEAGVTDEAAGYFEDEASPAKLFPASTYPVLANSMRLCLVRTDAWHKLGGLNAKDFPDRGFDIDFGLRARVEQFEHVCTTLVRATLAEPMRTSSDEASTIDIPLHLREQLPEQVTRIRKLHR